jgi:hypothetical protein
MRSNSIILSRTESTEFFQRRKVGYYHHRKVVRRYVYHAGLDDRAASVDVVVDVTGKDDCVGVGQKKLASARGK